MKFLFAPIGIVTGLLAGIAAQKAFERIWAMIDDEDPPEPDQPRRPDLKLVAALASRERSSASSKASPTVAPAPASPRSPAPGPARNRPRSREEAPVTSRIFRSAAVLVLLLAALAGAAAPAQAAFPGVAGPIAYQRLALREPSPGSGEISWAGGIFTHGPERSDLLAG